MIAAGEELVRRLDESDLRVTGGFWYFFTDSNTWKLVIVSPEVKTSGPKGVYQKIQHIVGEARGPSYVALSDITVWDPDAPIVQSLRTAVHTGTGISGIRFARNTINGHYIEDSFIYRLN